MYILAGSSAFAALIWWVVPVGGLIGGIGYVIWVSKFKRKFESETTRSVGQFQRFQDSFREGAPEDEKN
jgi:cytochrome c-type biogenesis protein CcmH/NrfF